MITPEKVVQNVVVMMGIHKNIPIVASSCIFLTFIRGCQQQTNTQGSLWKEGN